jgi:hypothetical protein
VYFVGLGQPKFEILYELTEEKIAKVEGSIKAQ